MLGKTLIGPCLLYLGLLPYIPGTAGVHTVHVATPPPCLVLGGTDTQPPGQPQEQIPVDDPQAEMGIKPQLSSRDRVAKEMCSYLQEDFSVLTHSHKLLTS